jgi:hypothetical protein
LLNCSGGNMGSGRVLKRAFNHSFNYPVQTIPLANVPRGGGSYSPNKPIS